MDESQNCFLNNYENILGDEEFGRSSNVLNITVDQTKRYDNLFVNDLAFLTFCILVFEQVSQTQYQTSSQYFSSVEFLFGSTNFQIEKKTFITELFGTFFIYG